MQVAENYTLHGSDCYHKRRDLRKGALREVLLSCASQVQLHCHEPGEHSTKASLNARVKLWCPSLASAGGACGAKSDTLWPCAGQHTGRVVVTAAGELLLYLAWPEPYGGTGKERFRVLDELTLLVETELVVGERSVAYRTYHRRK